MGRCRRRRRSSSRNGDVALGYQVVGNGPIDLVYVQAFVNSVCLGPLHRVQSGLGQRVHTGEVELIDEFLRGRAVHIGARVGALAGPNEVLVSSTVRDLVAGSDLVLEDVGSTSSRMFPIDGASTA